MIIIPLLREQFFLIIAVAFVFEAFRIVLAYFLASESAELRKLHASRKETQVEIGASTQPARFNWQAPLNIITIAQSIENPPRGSTHRLLIFVVRCCHQQII